MKNSNLTNLGCEPPQLFQLSDGQASCPEGKHWERTDFKKSLWYCLQLQPTRTDPPKQQIPFWIVGESQLISSVRKVTALFLIV